MVSMVFAIGFHHSTLYIHHFTCPWTKYQADMSVYDSNVVVGNSGYERKGTATGYLCNGFHTQELFSKEICFKN